MQLTAGKQRVDELVGRDDLKVSLKVLERVFVPKRRQSDVAAQRGVTLVHEHTIQWHHPRAVVVRARHAVDLIGMLPVPSFPGHPSGWVRHGPVSPAEGSRVRDVPVRQHPAVQHEYEAPGGDDERGDKVRGAVPLVQDEPAPAHHGDDLGALGQRRRGEGEVLENLVLAHGGDQVAERDHGVQLQRRAFRGEPFTGEKDPRRARRHRHQSVHEHEKDGGLEKLRWRFLAPAPVRDGHQPFLQHSVYAQRY